MKKKETCKSPPIVYVKGKKEEEIHGKIFCTHRTRDKNKKMISIRI